MNDTDIDWNQKLKDYLNRSLSAVVFRQKI